MIMDNGNGIKEEASKSTSVSSKEYIPPSRYLPVFPSDDFRSKIKLVGEVYNPILVEASGEEGKLFLLAYLDSLEPC